VCKTGILTRLDYPSGKTARQLSGSILIVFGVARVREKITNIYCGTILIFEKCVELGERKFLVLF
jgi:hypothetical protein